MYTRTMANSDALSLLAGLLAGAGGGVLSGLFGIGGGIVLIPLLRALLGLNQHQAQGITLAALLLPNTLPAVWQFRRRGVPLHWPLVGAMIVAFLPGVWLGARFANALPDGPLRLIFVGFLCLLALRSFLQKKEEDPLNAARPDPPWAPGLLIGLIGGVCGGLFGIGGGVVMIPLLTLGLKLSQHEAQLTSIAVLLPPVGLPGVLVYARSQPLPWVLLAGVALGFQIGAFFGARLATRLPGARLQRLFALLLVFLAGLLMVR